MTFELWNILIGYIKLHEDKEEIQKKNTLTFLPMLNFHLHPYLFC